MLGIAFITYRVVSKFHTCIKNKIAASIPHKVKGHTEKRQVATSQD